MERSAFGWRDGRQFADMALSPDAERVSTAWQLPSAKAGPETTPDLVSGLARGSRIKTWRGEVPVQGLRPGDRILTRDNGYQTVRWICTQLSPANPRLSSGEDQVRIRKGALGRNKPDHALRVAPGQRLLLGGDALRQGLGIAEGLVAAVHLTCLAGVGRTRDSIKPVVHVLFDRHELILSEGTWCESFLPDATALTALSPAARAELKRRMPWLAPQQAGYRPARPVLSRGDMKRVAMTLRP
jgi:hypothetical protein